MKYLVLFFIAACALSSCTIEQKMHIFEGEQGRMMTSVDMSELGSMAEMMGQSADDMDLDQIFGDESMKDTLQMVLDTLNLMSEGTGVSNWNIGRDEEKVIIGYDFENFKSLKRLAEKIERKELSVSSEIAPILGMASNQNDITYKKKCYEIFLKGGDEMGQLPGMEEGGGEMDGMMNMMGDMMNFKQIYEFDRKIKKVESNLDFKQEAHRVIIELSLKDYIEAMEDEKNPPYLKVKVK